MHAASLPIGALVDVGGHREAGAQAAEDGAVTVELDAHGHATLAAGSKMRFAPPEKSALLRVFVFRKTG